MFLRTRTTARINAYMIYASSTSTLQPEQTDILMFELLSRASVKLAWCRAHMEPKKSHSRLHVLAVGT